jgi:hypothetical protein
MSSPSYAKRTNSILLPVYRRAITVAQQCKAIEAEHLRLTLENTGLKTPPSDPLRRTS